MTKSCPICGKPATEAHQPFCTDRCAKIDLGRWLNGAYAIPTEEPVGFDDPPAGDEPLN